MILDAALPHTRFIDLIHVLSYSPAQEHDLGNVSSSSIYLSVLFCITVRLCFYTMLE